MDDPTICVSSMIWESQLQIQAGMLFPQPLPGLNREGTSEVSSRAPNLQRLARPLRSAT